MPVTRHREYGRLHRELDSAIDSSPIFAGAELVETTLHCPGIPWPVDRPPRGAAAGFGLGSSREHTPHRSTPLPRHRSCRFRQPCLLPKGVGGPLAPTDDDPVRRERDDARRVDELPKPPGRARPGADVRPCGTAAVHEVRAHRQGRVEGHGPANVAAPALEVEERDRFTPVVLHLIRVGVGRDDFAGRPRFGPGVGQENGGGFVSPPRHDQVPHGAFGAVAPDPFLDLRDLAALPLGRRVSLLLLSGRHGGGVAKVCVV